MSTRVNITVNGTQPLNCSIPASLVAAKIGQTLVYCVLFIVSFFGNIFIGLIVYKTKNMRKKINYLIVNMAISDILFPIVVFPLAVTTIHVDLYSVVSVPVATVVCKLNVVTSHVSTAVSIQSIVLIAVDRFGAVVFPLRSTLIGLKLCLFLVLCAWIVAIFIHLPVFIAFEVVEYLPGKLACVTNTETFGEFFSFKYYVLALSVGLINTPIALMTILYSIIIFKLNSQKIPSNQSANFVEQRLRRNRNVLKMAVAILLGFAICWVPHSIALYFSFFGEHERNCDLLFYRFIALFISRANCAINPCICFIFSGNYRQGLKRLLGCLGRQ